MLDVYKQSLAPFPYPFTDRHCWVEILTGSISPICYLVMPPDDLWPHWQIYMNPDPPYLAGYFAWSSDGRVGPHRDRRGGFPCGPTLFVGQDRGTCQGCKYLDADDNDEMVVSFIAVDDSIPSWAKALSRHKVCRFVHGPDLRRCPGSADAWDAALLPISIILYIALAPTRELDISWRPPRVLGHGKTLRRKMGYYYVTPIKKVYFHRRVATYLTGEARQIERRFSVRGHVRHSHLRRCPSGSVARVREHWVRPSWKGQEGLASAPHRYAVDWPADVRVEAARRLLKEVNYERRRP